MNVCAARYDGCVGIQSRDDEDVVNVVESGVEAETFCFRAGTIAYFGHTHQAPTRSLHPNPIPYGRPNSDRCSPPLIDADLARCRSRK
jgi:hypothetical protein